MNIANKTYTVCSITSARKFLCGLFLLLICNNRAFAQRRSNASSAKLITQVPFTTFTGGVVVIRAVLVGYPDTLNFIMDTGSGGISLDSTTCLRLNLAPVLTDKLIMGIGGIRQLRYVNNQSLRLGNMQIDSLNFHVSDYDILSSVYGDRIDGIIGYSFFTRYIVKIDYDSSQMYIYTKGSIKYPSGGFLLKPVILNLPVQGATLRDTREVTSRFYFDTGAGLCLLLNSDFIRDSSILNPEKKPLPTQAQGMGGKANMQVTVMKEFRIGPYRFRNIPTHIFDDEYNVTSYPYLAGLIGNDVLRRFNIILNYDKKIFYLTPNSHFRDPFDYSYTGLGLYWIEGEIRVGDIMKDSPAEKAGLKVDDVVVSVNDNMSQNLHLYKSMLQNTGDKVKILVNRRPEGMLELVMKVKSIF
ncbi:MAG: aspartyl protease family protein [Bacteroidota bacterium]|nr:aspartyl protease family protein [Bacteroidota bacterium]